MVVTTHCNKLAGHVFIQTVQRAALYVHIGEFCKVNMDPFWDSWPEPSGGKNSSQFEHEDWVWDPDDRFHELKELAVSILPHGNTAGEVSYFFQFI